MAYDDPLSLLDRATSVGKMLVDLFAPESGTDGTLFISCHGGDDGGVTVSFVGHGRNLVACRDTLFHSLRVLLSRQPQKVCGGPCGRTLNIEQFAINSKNADGRCRRCRVCERKRIADWERRRELSTGGRRRTRG